MPRTTWRFLGMILAVGMVRLVNPASIPTLDIDRVSPSSSRFTVDDQVYLSIRAMLAINVLPSDSASSTYTLSEFRWTQCHHELKRLLTRFVDHDRSHMEYIYVARLLGDRKNYEHLVSTSSVIENHPLRAYSLSDGMARALDRKVPYVVNFDTSTPAVYWPLMNDNGEVNGFLVFVKLFWEDDARRFWPEGIDTPELSKVDGDFLIPTEPIPTAPSSFESMQPSQPNPQPELNPDIEKE